MDGFLVIFHNLSSLDFFCTSQPGKRNYIIYMHGTVGESALGSEFQYLA